MGRIIGLTFEEAVEAIEEVAVEEEAPATEEAVEKEPKKSTKKGK